MKLNFNPEANITKIDYFLGKLNLFRRKVDDLVVVRNIVSNWYDVLLFRLGFTKGFVMKLRDGNKVRVISKEDYFNWWDSTEGQKSTIKAKKLNDKININTNRVNFQFNNKNVILYYDSQKQLVNTLGMINEQFIEQEYKWLNVKDKYVIDIGANIGDTAIYFGLMGAKHVYAFEPYPYSYALAKRNIAKNSIKQVTLLNMGVGFKPLKIRIKTDYKNYGGTNLKTFKTGQKIKIITLEDIVKRYNKIDGGILKIDCEGCEYGIILNTKNETLQKFDQIMIEYHYGYKNLLIKLKEAGFKVKVTIPRFLFNLEAENHNMVTGMIYAERRVFT